MESLLIAACTLALVLLLALMALAVAAWRWRAEAADGRLREREDQARLADARTQAALGDEARRALGAAHGERAAAAAQAAAADAGFAAARAELQLLRSEREAARQELIEARQAGATLAGELSQRLAESGAAQAGLSAAQAALVEQRQRLAAAEATGERLRSELAAALDTAQQLRGDVGRHEALASERLQAQEQAREQLSVQLRSLGQQLFEEQGRAMLGEGRQQLEQTLTPFRERLVDLQNRINQVHATDLQDRASLHGEIRNMFTAQQRLSAEAEQLGRALRADTKAQGTWGELTLQRLLEASQLEEGLAYDLQVAVRSEEGARGRPDAVIFLPDHKALAIDAKVSLTAFMRATNASTEGERALALQEHLGSVRAHLKGLADRDYPEAIQESLRGSVLDLTLLFLPSEAAFAAAISQDAELWAEALRQRVIIVSPTTLLATLRVVAQIWRVEKQNANADLIAREAGAMLEKLRGALEDLDKVEAALTTAQEVFGRARAKLLTGKGNLQRRAEKILRLGAPAKDETRQRLQGDGDDDGPELEEGAVNGDGAPSRDENPAHPPPPPPAA
jgi:DNA recombination protein RmuC